MTVACELTKTPTEPTPTNEIIYTALAASDGVGIGASRPCTLGFELDCDGNGYVYLLKHRLEELGLPVTLRNLSVPGAVVSPAFQQLAQNVGRVAFSTLLDQATVVRSDTTHVTIFTGGNDANIIADSARRSGDVRGTIDQHVQRFGTDVDELVRRVRAKAPNARIVILNLPNLAVAPYVAGYSLQERSALQYAAVRMTDHINLVAAQNGLLVADLMCDGRIYDGSAFSSDGFHPSDRGYALMADVTYPVLASGSAPAPSSSCGPRSALPAF